MKKVTYNLKLDEAFFIERGTDFVDISSLPQLFEVQCKGKQIRLKLVLMRNEKGLLSGNVYFEIEEEIEWE